MRSKYQEHRVKFNVGSPVVYHRFTFKDFRECRIDIISVKRVSKNILSHFHNVQVVKHVKINMGLSVADSPFINVFSRISNE